MSAFSRLLTRVIDRFYFPFVRRIVPLQTFRYAVCGMTVLVLGLGLYELIYRYLLRVGNIDVGFMVLSPHVATLAAVFPVTFLAGFYLQRNVAFRSSPLRTHVQMIRYLLSTAGSLGLNVLMLKIFVDLAGMYGTLGEFFATVVVTVYSYLMQKYFTFRGCIGE